MVNFGKVELLTLCDGHGEVSRAHFFVHIFSLSRHPADDRKTSGGL